ncbi:Transmembrane protein 245 [Auxenochlorella protothecoides]|uniref:Transmembrane protein 245 n=1 Tax=Auxenochlorella protothecoides TaxID=3075 RepID=A0A087SFP0_AUXPR|nr:Transmembrane protein 245 [Auxenochlorella protothecoides]KFM24544.1 Transmembrane protein 245 [Auxenochlorella protothecoides]
MESSFSNRGDREEDARPALPQRAYLQIALYASGNALAALIGLLLWNLYAVLADYRDAAVYALLCSVALRGPKTWLVDYLGRELAHRSILQSLFNLACLPLTTLVEAWMEGRVLMLRWQQLAVERHRQLRRLSLAAATSAGEAPSSPRTPTPRTSSSRLGSVTTLRTLPTLALFAEAGVRALQSRRTSRRRARRQGRRAPAGGGSAAMFRWLFRACLLWGACDWARRAWGGTVQLVLLAATAVMGVGLLFGLLFGLKWYLRRAGASPAKAPRDAASEPRAGAVKRPRFGGAASLRARRPTPVYARTEASARLSLRRNLHPIVAAGLVAALLLGSSGLSGLLAVRVAQEGRSVVASARDAFPSAWSEVGLRGARLFSEDGGEGSGGAEGSVAGAWAAGGAAAISRRSGGGTTLAAESAAACNVSAGESCAAPGVSALGAGAGQEAACGSPGTPEVSLNVSSALPRGVIEDKGTSSALREGPAPCTAQSRLPAWVQNQGQQALALAQRALPSLETWLEGAASRFLAAQNLTASLTDAKLAYEMVQGPRQCGRREHTGLLVTLAGAEVAAADATAAEQAAAEKVGTLERVMGGLGVLRLGLGVVKAALQATLFLALLYYLLAAPQDPLAKALGAGYPWERRGSVLLASAKLMAFHGVFTWLTFRVFGVPLAYTAAVLSAVCALLPFIPTYAVALPGSGLLAAQGHIPGAIVLLLVHWGAYYLGDTLILEDIPGGHPYLLSLGILGGIWTFDNPFQGCLFGPILLSLLSAFYRLHGEFMGMVSADGERGGLGLTTPRAAVPALFASPFGTKGGERGSAPHSPPAPVLQPTPPTPRQDAHKGLELSPVDGCEDRVPARALAPAGTASAENGDSASDTSPLKEDSVPESFSFGYHPHEE